MTSLWVLFEGATPLTSTCARCGRPVHWAIVRPTTYHGDNGGEVLSELTTYLVDLIHRDGGGGRADARPHDCAAQPEEGGGA